MNALDAGYTVLYAMGVKAAMLEIFMIWAALMLQQVRNELVGDRDGHCVH